MGPERRRVWLALVSIFALASLVYANSLANGFALDDVGIIEKNPQVHGLGHFSQAVTGPYWSGGTAERGLYRPVTLGTYALDWELWDGDPFGFHLVNILLHGTVSVLVFLLLLRLGSGLAGACVGAALFAVHPVHVEAVANIVGRAEILSTLFFMSAVLMYLHVHDHGWRMAAALAGLYLLALGSKENAVTLPGVLLISHLLDRHGLRSAAASARRSWRVYLGLGVVLVGYFVLRKLNIGVFLGTEDAPWFWGLPDHARILTAIRTWPEYLRLMLLPLDLVPDYGPGVIVPETRPFSPLVLLGLLTAALLALVAWRGRQRAPLITAGIIWFAITVLPVTGILFPVGVILAERTLYLPSVGLAMAIVPGVQWLHGRSSRWQPAMAGIALLLILAAARTWTANPVWRSSSSVLDQLLTKHPANYRAQWGLSKYLLAEGDTAAALDHIELAARMAPGYYNLRVEYGQILMHAGAHIRALAQFDTALQIIPRGEVAYVARVRALLQAGHPGEAAVAAASGLTWFPDDPVLAGLLAQALGRSGEYEKAARARRRSIQLSHDGGSWHQWVHLAAMALMSQDTTTGREALQQARALAPVGTQIPPLEHFQELLRAEDSSEVRVW